MNQAEYIHRYADENREHFNDELIQRNDEEIIECLKKVILSCQRKNQYFSIRVKDFRVVENYSEILEVLEEQDRIKTNKKKTISSDKKYDKDTDFIVLNDSDIKLLVVTYYIEVTPEGKEPEGKDLRVVISIPRIVDKYYMRINGKYYKSIYQIVDGSTYNNSQSMNSKNQNIVFKSFFMATRIYRYIVTIKPYNGDKMECTYYSSIVFSKKVPALVYLLAEFGLNEVIRRAKCYGMLFSTNALDFEEPDRYYIFRAYKIYISIPKYIFDNDPVVQSLIYTLLITIKKDNEINDITTKDFWLKELGEYYGIKSTSKGENILESLYSIYDIITQEQLKLPEEDKDDIMDILLWLVREFPELRLKDNLDIGSKRIRSPGEYIANYYAKKITTGLYRTSDEDKITLDDIEKSLYTFPDYLLRVISKEGGKLMPYKDAVNDTDAYTALKYTYKGISGLGDSQKTTMGKNYGSPVKGTSSTSIPPVYRQVQISHLGRIDLDSISPSDPGLSGMLCPLSDIKDGFFDFNFKEPNEWRQDADALLDSYRQQIGFNPPYKKYKGDDDYHPYRVVKRDE